MCNKPISPKLIGFFLLIPSVLIFIGVLLATFILPSFGFVSGVSFINMIPFLILMLFFFAFSSVCIYISILYFKNKPYKENKSLGLIFVVFGIGYFIYSSLSCLISNLTGNVGGYAGVVIAFLILLIIVPIGLGLKNGYK
ncbi:hypothetical protein [Clostridium sp.]|uniref:hypothetical protein n=1 Tax=Clostridium sp. TaxID=1506 RepID=UPI001A3E74FD|nr:hypothetical protein [Clostridium sp.]MBK5240007.1 hypothetical protein [Clostridium sp.]